MPVVRPLALLSSNHLITAQSPTRFPAPSMAHAIFRTGGKQFRATEGDHVRIPRLDGNQGDKVTFDEVLAVDGDNPKFGQPLVAGAKVEAEILGQCLDKKIIVFKFRRRKRYKRKNGHRQAYTEVKVTGISA
ncbi:MAG: ribosomal protein [Pseudomonadota bacterium]